MDIHDNLRPLSDHDDDDDDDSEPMTFESVKGIRVPLQQHKPNPPPQFCPPQSVLEKNKTAKYQQSLVLKKNP